VTKVLLVDWLGRGGIAQTSESWAIELQGAGADVRVVTRTGRELGAGAVPTIGPPEGRNAVLAHASLCRFAARQIRTWLPDVVVVQNYVIPVLEEQVHRAARRVGAKVIVVVHDHRHHEWREGGRLGLRRQLRLADEVVVHSTVVGAGLARRTVRLVPLPVQLGVLAATGSSPLSSADGRLLALQVGVLNRTYKGTDIAVELATRGVDGWSFAFAGVGAPTAPGAQTIDRFLDAGELRAAVEEADALILPYRHATQSGAVVLAQVCGTVPLATAVDGLIEQIEDGVTGLLLPPDAPVVEWRRRLTELGNAPWRTAIEGRARAHAWRQHEQFRAAVTELVGLPLPAG
jgi:glycosyltransferase involved in cell wall biosynthesis